MSLRTISLFYCFMMVFVPVLANGQNIVLAAHKMNVAYVGISNPIEVALENTPCKDVIVVASEGELRGQGCIYNFIPKKVGRVDISVYLASKNARKKIGVMEVRVKNFPKPALTLTGTDNGYITIGELTIATPQVEFENCVYDTSIIVTGCTLELKRGKDSSTIYTRRLEQETGVVFDEEAIRVFRQLSHGDVVILKDVVGSSVGNRRIPLPELKLYIAY